MLSKRIIINCNVLTKGYDDKTIDLDIVMASIEEIGYSII